MSFIGILFYWCVHTATSCHLLKLVLLCPHCTMSPVGKDTITSLWQHLVSCWVWNFCICTAQCGLLRLVLSHPYGKVWSPAETSTFVSILHSVACWDWCCHVHMATSCHLFRPVLSCPYCKILPSSIQIDAITSTVQVECTAKNNYILTAVLQSINP